MISAVIVSFRSTKVLLQCLNALASELSEGDEVIVIENSQDQEIAEIPLFSQENFTLKINECNVGYSKACNQGIQMAANERILLLNPDTIPKGGAMDALRGSLFSADANSLFAVELINPDGTRQDYYRRFPSVRAILVMFFIPFRFQHLFQSYKHYTYRGDYASRISFEQPPGAGLVVPKNARLDEEFFVYGSDLMLCWEFAKNQKHEVTLLPAQFIHLRGQGGTSSSPDLADWLRVESARGFAKFYFKSGQTIRQFSWILSFATLEAFGVLRFVLHPSQRQRRIKRLREFLSRK